MGWIRFPNPASSSDFHGEERPEDAASLIDDFWNNVGVLMDESPCGSGSPIGNGGLTTAATAYGDGSILGRFDLEYRRPGKSGQAPRSLDFKVYAKISGGGTGKLRFSVGPAWVVPGLDPPPNVAWAESNTFTSATGQEAAATVDLSRINLAESTVGTPEGGVPFGYDVARLTIDGRTAGAGTITIMAYFDEEPPP